MTQYFLAEKPEYKDWPENWKEIVTRKINSLPDNAKEKWKAPFNNSFSETLRIEVQSQFITDFMEIKTIDINTKEWRDKTYGNTYFSARVTIDYGMPSERGFCLPFQYGYSGAQQAVAEKLFPDSALGLRLECERRGIILRESTKQVKKREAKLWGECEYSVTV